MSEHIRSARDGFVFSRFSGEDSLYVGFPESEAGEAGAFLIPLDVFNSLVKDMELWRP